MALFGLGKKKEGGDAQTAAPMGPPAGLPVDQVATMRQQGMTNNQIVQALQRDGFDTTQIFDALNQADMQATGAPQQGYDQPMPQDMGAPDPYAAEPYPQQPMDYGAPPSVAGGERERIEEMAETIIDEKWDELIKNINKIVEWKDKTEQRISKMEQQMVDLKDHFDKLHKAIIGKISEYDQNIINVGTEVKAMERVFQKILPTFTENVNELSRITKGIKKK
jgi:hypothetical protein